MKKSEYVKILSYALESEIDANMFYLAIADKAKDTYVKHLFSELAADELKQAENLEGFLNTDAKAIVFLKGIDYKISETIVKPEITADMKFKDAVALAMKNEQNAMDMYNAMSDSSYNAEQKQMFEAMAVMDKSHKTILEDIYNQAAYNEVW
jgi:rubrerythrin